MRFNKEMIKWKDKMIYVNINDNILFKNKPIIIFLYNDEQ